MTELVEVLQRWSDSGGLWRVLIRTEDSATVGLFRCDGGEQLDEIRSSAPDFLAFLAGRDSSLD